MSTFSIALSSEQAPGADSSDFTVQLSPPLVIEDGIPYRVCCSAMTMWNTVQFVSSANQNNQYRYSSDGGVTWHTQTLPNGAYDVKNIDDAIHAAMIANGDALASTVVNGKTLWALNVLPNEITGKIQVYIPGTTQSLGPYMIDFYTLSPIVGSVSGLAFGDPTGASQTLSDLPNKQNLTNGLTTAYLHTNLVNRGNGLPSANSSDVIATFVPSGSGRFSYEPTQFKWISIDAGTTINNIRVYLTDQNGRPLVTGNTVTCEFQFAPSPEDLMIMQLNSLNRIAPSPPVTSGSGAAYKKFGKY